MREVIQRLVGLQERSRFMDMGNYLREVRPHHGHLREGDYSSFEFSQMRGPEAILRLGLFAAARQYFGGENDREFAKSPAVTRIVKGYGIEDDVYVSRDPKSLRPRMLVLTKLGAPGWNPEMAVKLLSEIDSKLEFKCVDTQVSEDILGEIENDACVIVNGTRVKLGGQVYAWHGIVLPQVGPQSALTDGVEDIRRTHTYLQSMGVRSGIDGMVPTEQTLKALDVMEKSLV